MSGQIIKCISVCKYFYAKDKITKAVDDVSLQINMNEFVLIKGRSGAGKSTLLNLMCGLDRPTKGSVSINNEVIGELSNRELSKFLSEKIGIIFQNFNLLPTYTVFENIELALDASKVVKGKNRIIILPLLEQLGMTDKIHSLPTELSIGQQQKVAIARTLAKNPAVIFADEPTGSVDDETASEILSILLSLKEERKLTLVMASHGSALDKYADRIVTMKSGKLEC